MPRRTAWALALALLTAAPLAGAIPFLTPKVTVEYDHSAQLSHRTYSWGDTRMSLPRYVDIVKALIDKDLRAKGWQLVPTGGSATVFLLGNTEDGPSLVAYYASQGAASAATPGAPTAAAADGANGPAQGATWAQNWGPNGWGAGWKPGYGLEVYNALGTAGNHLVVDVFDTASHRLMFRGVTGEDLSNSDKKNTGTFEKSLKAMFKKLPKK